MYHAHRFTLEKIESRLTLVRRRVYARRVPIPDFRYLELTSPELKSFTFTELDPVEWARIEPHTYWGRPRSNFILRSEIRFPREWDAAAPTSLYLPLGETGDFSHPEALIYLDGKAYAACDRHHQEILLPPEVLDGAVHTLILHGWTGLSGNLQETRHTPLQMLPCEIVQMHEPTRKFEIRSRLALETAAQLDEDHPARSRLLNALDDAFKLLELRENAVGEFYESVPGALKKLDAGIASCGSALDPVVHAAGHAHIDVAWLWTLGQTRQKAARTFHTVLRYMEQFPGYRFTQSQPQLYEYIREDFPGLFRQIQERVAEGRWELTGGMWVEADCNISGAEALARQFMLGRSYFREHFGAGRDTPVLWLPDVFGYAWALPQLIKEAGLEYFMTIKISWNQYNRMPYDTFWWQGLDGTRILTHFSTTPDPDSQYGITYNAKADPAAVLGTWKKFKQKEVHNDLLMAYGYGDGGGGPTREMIENIEQMDHFPGLPQVRFSGAGDFFQALAKNLDERLPVWNGELYLEYHRGTYTTQARSKRANRKAEFALHDAEFLSTLAALETGSHYPQERFTTLWRILCLNQFHDILPGSSIQEVYRESQKQYQSLFSEVDGIIDSAFSQLAARTEADILAANASPFTQTALILLPDAAGEVRGAAGPGGPLPCQRVAAGLLIQPPSMPPYSVGRFIFSDAPSPEIPTPARAGIEGDRTVLENRFLKAEWDTAGDLVRVWDKQAGRDVLPAGTIANQFQAFEDRPLRWDAWDIDIFYEDRSWAPAPADSIEIIEEGPLRAGLLVRRTILSSDYTQRIFLDHNRPILTFHTEINWQESQIMLKVAFPVDVLAPQATYEIQWGAVQRPTHRNTSWDWARFETCAHKWVDLSEGDYGVSLINDCKYGHDIHDNTLRITLLRAPSWPDPDADRGAHTFTYEFFPHSGGLDTRTLAAAYALNDPVRVYLPDGRSGSASPRDGTALVRTDQTNAVVETIKQAEDGDGVIIRLFESQRRRGAVTIRFALPVAAVWETDLMETNRSALPVEDNCISVQMRPFQIMTLRVRFTP